MARLRSLIFVPGNNSRFLEKAKTLTADIVCFDLEDSIPIEDKEVARNLIKDALGKRDEYNSELYVRTNSPVSGLVKQDLFKIVQKGIDGIVIPKVNNVSELKKIIKTLSTLEKKRKIKPIQIIPSIESSQGVVNTYSIAASSKRIQALVFGVFDLLNDLGIEYVKQSEGAKYARSKIPLDARAAGKYVIDAIWQDLADESGLEEDCMIGHSLGYIGKSIIHPNQIPVVHKIFYPTQTEIEWAKKVCKVYLESIKKRKGATVVDGKMIDDVHFKRAKSLLESINVHV